MRLKDYFEEFLEYKRKEGCVGHTVGEYKRFLYGALLHCPVGEKRLRQIRLTDIAEIREAGRQHGEHGETRTVSCFRQLFKYLDDRGERMPFNWVKIKVPKVNLKEQPVFSREELKMILDSFPLNSSNVGTRKIAWGVKTLYEVLFGTTMRIFEALSLKREQWQEIKEKKETTIKGKGGDERKVYFSDRSIYWLDAYLKNRNDNNPMMFVNAYGEPLTTLTAKSYISRFRKQFGELGKKLKSHTMRRTSTTMMLEEGMDLKSVQTIGGWKSERTILRHYAIANRKRAKNLHNQILDKVINRGG